MARKWWLLISAALLTLVVVVVGFKTKKDPGWLPAAEASAAGAYAPEMGYPTYDDLWLLSRVVSGEAHSEPYVGQVGVCLLYTSIPPPLKGRIACFYIQWQPRYPYRQEQQADLNQRQKSNTSRGELIR